MEGQGPENLEIVDDGGCGGEVNGSPPKGEKTGEA